MSKYSPTVDLPTEENQKTFEEFIAKIPSIIEKTGYDELYGQQLNPQGKEYDLSTVQSIVYKFFKANDFKIKESVDQLTKTLEWRKEFKPLKAGFYENHDDKFKNIGYLTVNEKSPQNFKVITWNLYGETDDLVKNPKEYFENIEEFTRWRIGLMEQAIGLLDFNDTSNNKIAQVHDYSHVSFLSSDKNIKKVGKEIVKLFQDYYPEFLSTKYFLNFPFILAWVYNFIVKNWFISAETIKKFHILHNGKDLAKDFKAVGLPKIYGGDGEDLKTQNISADKIKKSKYTETILQENFEAEADEVD